MRKRLFRCMRVLENAALAYFVENIVNKFLKDTHAAATQILRQLLLLTYILSAKKGPSLHRAIRDRTFTVKRL